jgi:hypothetical protein
MTTTRRPPVAVRNNNAGNLRYVESVRWQGQEGPGDGGFARFATVQHGFRAAARQIMTYSERDRIKTVAGIITRWAPPRGSAGGVAYTQDTGAYIRRVARELGVGPDDEIAVQDVRVMRTLLVAIAEHEAGLRWPFAVHHGAGYEAWTDATLDEGLRMAGFDLAPAPLPEQPVARDGALMAGTGIGAVTVAEVLPHVPALGDTLGRLGPWIAGALILAVAAVVIWRRWTETRRMAGVL